MPAGLDGNPNPVVSVERTNVLSHLAEMIIATCPDERAMIGIDGAGGTGKSTMADELARLIEIDGRQVVRATVDSFHRPRAERHARGKDSPEGYYRDSHQLEALRSGLLDPFAAGKTTVRRAVFDEPSDSPAVDLVDGIAPDGVLLFDGLFLHRPELAPYWHLSFFLIADGRRDDAWLAYKTVADPEVAEAARRRYFDGMALYEREASPRRAASLVIDNDDLLAPRIIDRI